MARPRTTTIALALLLLGCQRPIPVDEPPLEVGQATAPTEATVQEPTYSARVVGASDGDTIKVLVGDVQKRIRLEGIDTPELGGQPFGKAAKEFTARLCFGKEVHVFVSGQDRYKRDLAFVLVGEKNINQELLSAGLAWHFKRYNKDKELSALEVEARRLKRGLWAEPNPIPPWDWRKSKKEKKVNADADIRQAAETSP